jgi:hypothetical protein
MKEKTDITIKLLDSILKETMKKGEISIERYLSGKGYSKRIARSIQVKLINDGYVALVNDGECSIKISANGQLFVNDGGYKRALIKEYIPPITALIGCITGTISFIWHIVSLFLQ